MEEIERGWWKITYTIEPDDPTLEHVAELIKKGFTQGEMLVEVGVRKDD